MEACASFTVQSVHKYDLMREEPMLMYTERQYQQFWMSNCCVSYISNTVQPLEALCFCPWTRWYHGDSWLWSLVCKYLTWKSPSWTPSNLLILLWCSCCASLISVREDQLLGARSPRRVGVGSRLLGLLLPSEAELFLIRPVPACVCGGVCAERQLKDLLPAPMHTQPSRCPKTS